MCTDGAIPITTDDRQLQMLAADERLRSKDVTTDEQLVSIALTGDNRAFDELVRRYMVPLRHFLQQHNRRADADDLLQETFIRAYNSLASYKPAWRFSTWLFTIGRRLSINAARRKVADTNIPSLKLHQEDDLPGPHEQMVRTERRENVWQTARRVLDEPQWTALWLHYVEQMPTAEIARIQDRTRISVKTMMSRARKRLRRELGEYELE